MRFGDYSSFAFVDVETTGTSASGDRVLEVGIIRVEEGVIVGEINTLLDPEMYIPPEITTITGISGNDILNAPHFSDVVDEVSELLNGAVFVAHNARFDYAFLKHEFRRLGLPFTYKTLDTVKLSRTLYPRLPRHNLDAIISFLNIEVKNRHRAYDDAYVLYELLKRVHNEFPQNEMSEVFNNFLKSPSLPTNISKAQIEALPDGPGVYIMYGDNESILYIGKSVDIKARVLSHFYNDFDSATDLKLSREVKRIESIQTAGDLGASLTESAHIKKHFPVYNRLLRQSQDMVAIVETERDGYLCADFKSVKEVDFQDNHKILGVFRSKKQASERLREIAKEYTLCQKLLGIEKIKGRCFGTQIGTCNGACVGEEPPFKYNVRFVEAFSHLRVPTWPFSGLIGIKEQFEEIEELHIINNWCYIGSIKNESEQFDYVGKTSNVKFDWDSYKILHRFIKKHAKTNTIIQLTQTHQSGEEE